MTTSDIARSVDKDIERDLKKREAFREKVKTALLHAAPIAADRQALTDILVALHDDIEKLKRAINE